MNEKTFIGSIKTFDNQYGIMHSLTLNPADLKLLHSKLTKFTTQKGQTFESVSISIKESKKGNWYAEIYERKNTQPQSDSSNETGDFDSKPLPSIDPDDLPF